ncbi:MAG: regulatory protein RecX [Verrucomicrobia bacterium]|nr:regulatory protein RecX [Verrucomicrobiota bacterium]MBS0635920.1 regulatory protein RecX [Verrucomicrobiota bacterium]
MRLSVKKIEKQLELSLEGELLRVVHAAFAKTDIASWDISSKNDFFDRFWPLEEKVALQLSLMKLARKSMHSEQIKLLLEGFSEGAVNKALEELRRLGLVHDEDFEAQFVKKLQKQGKSRLQISLKARQKGISPKKLVFGSEEDTLRALIEKRYPVLLDKDCPYEKKQKALGALYRRGFSMGTISCILKEFIV